MARVHELICLPVGAACLYSHYKAKGAQCLVHGYDAWPGVLRADLCQLPEVRCLQRSEVIVDACMLSSGESTFLQQATHLTGGIYLRPKHRGGLLQYLLVCLL